MQSITFTDIYLQLLLAMALGIALGIERFVAHKTAGMRTYTLVSVGSAMFVIVSKMVTVQYGLTGYDFHVVAQIIAAAGFLGVGAIFRTGQGVTGITTATGLWVAAAIGTACGFGYFRVATLVTALALFIFTFLWFIEKQINRARNEDDTATPLSPIQ
ncbi:MAG TPA: MgtC/SapB family protein [Candidatus Paceibacterota bacterium]|nr:MgtC/SapB family protein [Candidatus Paceibacterota bacterium]